MTSRGLRTRMPPFDWRTGEHVDAIGRGRVVVPPRDSFGRKGTGRVSRLLITFSADGKDLLLRLGDPHASQILGEVTVNAQEFRAALAKAENNPTIAAHHGLPSPVRPE